MGPLKDEIKLQLTKRTTKTKQKTEKSVKNLKMYNILTLKTLRSNLTLRVTSSIQSSHKS